MNFILDNLLRFIGEQKLIVRLFYDILTTPFYFFPLRFLKMFFPLAMKLFLRFGSLMVSSKLMTRVGLSCGSNIGGDSRRFVLGDAPAEAAPEACNSICNSVDFPCQNILKNTNETEKENSMTVSLKLTWNVGLFKLFTLCI